MNRRRYQKFYISVLTYSYYLAAHQMGKCVKESKDADFIDEITETFNNTLKFDPRLLKMAYTVRDPVPHGTYCFLLIFIDSNEINIPRNNI